MTRIRLSGLFLLAIACTPALAQLRYVPLSTPCRAVDTRQNGGAIAGNTTQVFDPGPACGIPSQGNAPIVFAMNVTVVPREGLGVLTIWATGAEQPLASTLNSYDGQVKSDYALVAGGVGTGDVSVFVSDTTDVILDVSGYFVLEPISSPSTPGMLFTPVTPCRLIDTRNSAGALGGPSLTAGLQRTFPLGGQCGLPDLSNGGALSVNVTAVPKTGSLGYLTVWGTSATGNTPPTTSTLNSPTGTVVANAAFLAINPGTNTSICAYAYNDTDLIVDVTGYFSEGTTGMAYYPTAVPERILDTRVQITAGFDNVPVPVYGGPPFTGEQTYTYTTGQAVYVVNATVVPSGPLWVLTLWPDGIAQPVVSTLNAFDAGVTSNMAIVSTGADGAFDAYADGGPTQLILDLSGSFMPLPSTSGPLVAFVGDEISAGLVAEATTNGANPGWQCINCLSSTTSTFALGNLPAVIAMKPSVVHILVGAHELELPNGDVVYDVGTPITNIENMVAMLKTANIPAVVGDMPPCPAIASYRFDYGLGYEAPTYLTGVPIIGYSSIGPSEPAGQQSPVCAANNFDPNAAGYSLMVPLAQQGIKQALQGAAKAQ
jgi:hypothetical protein